MGISHGSRRKSPGRVSREKELPDIRAHPHLEVEWKHQARGWNRCGREGAGGSRGVLEAKRS